MGENKCYGLIPHLDVEQILVDAQNRWLRPAEICEILRNFHNFHIAPEPPNRPPSGSIFLFDRKVLRYFRKDGHNWRKKKDGKTVKEAHERLKSGSIDVLHCYYAHGEENENFQRRSYWMLEDDFMHIVLVHYLEVKGNKTNRTKGVPEISHGVYDCKPVSLNSLASHDQITSQSTGDNSLYTTQISGYGDSETDNYQASSRYNSFPEMPQFDGNSMMDALLNYVPIPQNLPRDYEEERAISSYSGLCSLAQEKQLLNEASDTSQSGNYGITLHGPTSKMDLASWNETLEHCGTTYEPYCPSTFAGNLKSIHNGKDTMFSEVIIVEPSVTHENTAMAKGYQVFQDVGHGSIDPNVDVKKGFFKEGNILHSEEGLEKHDSFSRWMNGVDNSHIESSYGTYCDVAESESAGEDSSSSRQDHLYTYLLSPSLSQDQLFSIIDFSPNWAYANLETKVLVTGKFLKCKTEVERCKWSCMFGEVEVLAEILGDGILRCYAPPQTAGRVPFYITCSDRLACSEIRGFEYLASHAQYMEMSETYAGSKNETLLYTRLEKLLALGPNDPLELVYSSADEKSHLCNQISSLLLKADDELFNMVKEATRTDFTSSTAKDELLQKILKEKLHAWLLCKVVEDGNGPNVLDNEGQGVIHLVAGLGYDWAIEPIIVAGVNINFRDSRGWSALHWASSFGRRRTVAVLISLGAAPGALTDPTPEFPSGRTPADLASSNGHKGLSGFLAKSSLTTHLSVLTLRDSGLSATADISCVKAFEDNGESHAIKLDQEGMEVESPLQDSLSAVYVATLAAASIQQVFRMQSFQRKKLFDERVLSRVCGKSCKSGQLDEPVQAAVRIQNKFRGWKGRKEFTVIRQHIVKIQAHVRGHQVRKHFKKVVWSVGIMEKAILRWRRKGSGLRGFHSEAVTGDSNMLKQHTEEEDYDFLREGRKQTEARLERALARVKSMVQNPEGRDQYRRLLMDIQDIKESKSMVERILMEEIDDCAMFNIKELLNEDAPMPPSCV